MKRTSPTQSRTFRTGRRVKTYRLRQKTVRGLGSGSILHLGYLGVNFLFLAGAGEGSRLLGLKSSSDSGIEVTWLEPRLR